MKPYNRMLTGNVLPLFCLAITASACNAKPAPASDPQNKGTWSLVENVSDEFNSPTLDTDKWRVEGADGKYIKWKGRAPSQFSPDNAEVKNGKLIISTKWDPDFDFSEEPDKLGNTYENITTAAVIGKNDFHYGYMEIRCKAADASITSAFWMLGHKSELDVFEFNGRPSLPGKTHLESEMMYTMINWGTRDKALKRSWRGKTHLDWSIADDFHVYGCEWTEEYLKFFADGVQVDMITREELGDKWVLKHPLTIWVDSEVFEWQGMPKKERLPAHYEIDYIRVWQN